MNEGTGSVKTCTACGVQYAATTEFFSLSKSGKYGLHSQCKVCLAEYARKRRAANPEKAREYDRKQRAANPEKAREYARKCRAANPEKARESVRKWAAANPEKARESVRKWRAANLEKTREYDRKQYAANPEKARAHNHNRRARKRALPATWTAIDWTRALEYFGHRCVYCGAQPGLFAWGRFAADHFVPLTAPNCPGTVPTNMLPACTACNSSKQDADPQTWLPGTFGKRKATAILKRVNKYFAHLNTDTKD